MEKALDFITYTYDHVRQTDINVTEFGDFVASDGKELARFYGDYLKRISIHFLKALVKNWVNHFCEYQKQRSYRRKERKPIWWPEHIDCKSPNVLVKTGILLINLLFA